MKHEHLQPTYRILDDCEAMRGTSLQGHLTVSYTQLTHLFGEPLQGDGRKVDVQWIIETDAGIGTVYNYNLGEQAEVVEEITDWHVGGNDAAAYQSIVAFVQGNEENRSMADE